MRFSIVILFFFSYALFGQNKEISSQGQFWIGYMTNAKIADKYSLWNDFHYVPDGFFVARTGLTVSFFDKLNATAGFAYLNIPTQSEGIKLNRTEYRPWMQLVANHKLTSDFIMLNRVRYDMRYRQNFADGELLNNYNFNHRLRMLIGLRHYFNTYSVLEGTPFINLSNEIHVNFGKNIINNHFNQNRTWLTIGLKLDNLSFQTGYMHRFVKSTNNLQFMRNHTLIVWITQSFDFRKNKMNDLDDTLYQQP